MFIEDRAWGESEETDETEESDEACSYLVLLGFLGLVGFFGFLLQALIFVIFSSAFPSFSFFRKLLQGEFACPKRRRRSFRAYAP